MAGRAGKKCLFEDDVRAMLGMPKVCDLQECHGDDVFMKEWEKLLGNLVS